jgi:Leucine-rich repeat (LRR) protein
MDANPKSRRFRYSLRTLLVVVTIASAGFGWFGVKFREAKTQRTTVAALGSSGARARYDYEFDAEGNWILGTVAPPGPRWLRDLMGNDFFDDAVAIDWPRYPFRSAPTDDSLAHLAHLPRLKLLSIGFSEPFRNNEVNAGVTDAGLVHLRGLAQLEYLDLEYTAITDAGLANIKGATQLEGLVLGHTQVTDAGLVHLRNMTRLKLLFFDGTAVTDAGMPVIIQEFPQLENLRVGETQITDAGLKDLQRLTRLTLLNLSGTQITNDSLLHLRELPQLEIVWLHHTKTTKKGRDTLRAAKPKLQVMSDL